MKISALRKIIREEVKGAIQEELKDILLEAVKSPKQVVSEYRPVESNISTPTPTNPVASKTRAELREGYKNILGETAATFNTSQLQQPLQVTTTDTAGPNGQLPEGNVSMDQIMGLMNNK
jgi:hypothetical protein